MLLTIEINYKGEQQASKSFLTFKPFNQQGEKQTNTEHGTKLIRATKLLKGKMRLIRNLENLIPSLNLKQSNVFHNTTVDEAEALSYFEVLR